VAHSSASPNCGGGRRASTKPPRCWIERDSRRRCSSAAPASALEHLIRARVAQGRLTEARAALDSLSELGRLVATEALRASADMSEGILEAAGGNHELARTLLEDAVDRFERLGAPFETAQVRIDLAISLAALGQDELAERETTAALRSLLELGAEAEARRARRLLELSTRRNPDRPGSGGVTRREGQVLALLAEGLTNRQIAERLVISEHTVHRHVTNVLRKLDLTSRAAAAAYAVQSGLLDGTRK
jgi:LuxR family transcriptional regulator, maltose regulon positive regulatory protein